jgi:hypothetical protein
MPKLIVPFRNFANKPNNLCLEANNLQNHAISRYEMRFWNPGFVKVGEYLYLHYFYVGEGRRNSPIKRNSLQETLRRRCSVRRAYCGVSVKSTRKCMETNKPAEPFVVRTVSGRPVITPAHVGFVVDTAAVRQIFLTVLWFCLFNMIPLPFRTRSSIYR